MVVHCTALVVYIVYFELDSPLLRLTRILFFLLSSGSHNSVYTYIIIKGQSWQILGPLFTKIEIQLKGQCCEIS